MAHHAEIGEFSKNRLEEDQVELYQLQLSKSKCDDSTPNEWSEPNDKLIQPMTAELLEAFQNLKNCYSFQKQWS